jgi:hypothetical protein
LKRDDVSLARRISGLLLLVSLVACGSNDPVKIAEQKYDEMRGTATSRELCEQAKRIRDISRRVDNKERYEIWQMRQSSTCQDLELMER